MRSFQTRKLGSGSEMYNGERQPPARRPKQPCANVKLPTQKMEKSSERAAGGIQRIAGEMDRGGRITGTGLDRGQ